MEILAALGALVSLEHGTVSQDFKPTLLLIFRQNGCSLS